MSKYRWIAATLLLAAPTTVLAQDSLPAGAPAAPPRKLSEEEFSQRVSYALGRSIADDCRMGSVKLDTKALMKGVSDVAAGKESPWKGTEVGMTMRQFAIRIQRRIADDNKKQGEAFLAANGKKPGVKTTASGLQYKVLKEGKGDKPTLNDTVICHYRGTFITGGQFDASYGGDPAQFPVAGVIGGWTEALQLMKVGSKFQLFVPSTLAYKQGGSPPQIGPNETLVFEVELIDIAR